MGKAGKRWTTNYEGMAGTWVGKYSVDEVARTSHSLDEHAAMPYADVPTGPAHGVERT